MTKGLLNPDQRHQLESILTAEVPDRYRGYAKLILLYDEGHLTHQIAQAVGLSRSRVRHWRRQFQARGLSIFPADIQHAAQVTTPVSTSNIKTPEVDTIPTYDSEAPHEVSLERAKPKEKKPLKPNSLEAFLGTAKQLKSPGVLPDDPLAESGRKVLLYYFAQMLLHEDGTRLGKDIEELHDMRVATRRMRAAMEVFKEAYQLKAIKPHLKGLRDTGRALGKVRDLDVFLEKANAYLSEQPSEFHAGLLPLLVAWEEQRDLARKDMLAYLDSEKYHSFKEKFFYFLSTPGSGTRTLTKNGPSPNLVNEIVPVLIYTRLGAVRSFEAVLDNATIEQLHALRIEFKKLRYTVEFFKEVLGDTSKTVIDDIKVMQDHLGDLNDAEVATELLREFLTQWDLNQISKPIQERLSHQPIMAYLSYQYEKRHQLLLTFHDKWAHFNRPEFRRDLALAISVL